MGEFSLMHWLIILVILLLFFGPSKLPGLGSSLGKAIRGFKAGLNEIDPDNHAANNQTPARTEQLTSGNATQDSVKSKQNEKA